jgi:hypothetical protein
MITISNRRALTQTQSQTFVDGRPCFDPSGKTVLFERAQGGLQYSQLWSVALAGPGSESLYYSANHDCLRASWSWNTEQSSHQIAFTGTNFPVYTINADPSNFDEQQLSVTGYDGASLSYPAWYPSSELLIANYSDYKLIKADLSGNFLGELTASTFWSGMGTLNQAAPDIIAYAGQLAGSGVYHQKNNKVWLQDGNDAPEQVSPLGKKQIGRAPWFTPDGQYIGYENIDTKNVYQVWLQALIQPYDQQLPVQVSVGGEVSQHIKFSPDGATAVWAQGGCIMAADIKYS